MQGTFSNQEITKMLDDMRRKAFWGTIELQLQRGTVLIIRTHETIKKEMNHPQYNDRPSFR